MLIVDDINIKSLDISNQETEKKHETEKFKIFNEIDIEEEIRRILN